MFIGPLIKKGDGALGAIGANEDNIHGMVCTGTLPADGTYDTFNVGVKLVQASDADAMGFDAAYDANATVLVRYHIDEYFRLNPNGILWFMLCEQSKTLTELCDNENPHVNQLIIDSLKKVKTIAVTKNPEAGTYDPDLDMGMDADVATAIAKAQQLIDGWRAENIFIDGVILPGMKLSMTSGDWGDLRTLVAPNVMVVIAQDKDIADLDAAFEFHAAVGTTLGALGVRRVEQDLGSVEVPNNPNNNGNADYPINNVADGLWIRPALSSGKLCKDLTAPEMKLIVGYVNGTTVVAGLGYVCADSFPNYPGVFFSKGAACTAQSSDFAYYVNSRVWNKAARIALMRLIPKTNSTVEVIDGKIGAETIGEWVEEINDSKLGLGTMVTLGHTTKSAVFIDPDQDVFGTSQVVCELTITPFGYARDIVGNLGFSIN